MLTKRQSIFRYVHRLTLNDTTISTSHKFEIAKALTLHHNNYFSQTVSLLIDLHLKCNLGNVKRPQSCCKRQKLSPILNSVRSLRIYKSMTMKKPFVWYVYIVCHFQDICFTRPVLKCHIWFYALFIWNVLACTYSQIKRPNILTKHFCFILVDVGIFCQ